MKDGVSGAQSFLQTDALPQQFVNVQKILRLARIQIVRHFGRQQIQRRRHLDNFVVSFLRIAHAPIRKTTQKLDFYHFAAGHLTSSVFGGDLHRLPPLKNGSDRINSSGFNRLSR